MLLRNQVIIAQVIAELSTWLLNRSLELEREKATYAILFSSAASLSMINSIFFRSSRFKATHNHLLLVQMFIHYSMTFLNVQLVEFSLDRSIDHPCNSWITCLAEREIMLELGDWLVRSTSARIHLCVDDLPFIHWKEP